MFSKTRAHWPWEDQGTFGCLAVEGESYCLTHPCPPGEDQGSLENWPKDTGSGGGPQHQPKRIGKSLLAAFLRSWDLFDFWVHMWKLFGYWLLTRVSRVTSRSQSHLWFFTPTSLSPHTLSSSVAQPLSPHSPTFTSATRMLQVCRNIFFILANSCVFATSRILPSYPPHNF